jgi:hypothetical protein
MKERDGETISSSLAMISTHPTHYFHSRALSHMLTVSLLLTAGIGEEEEKVLCVSERSQEHAQKFAALEHARVIFLGNCLRKLLG